MAKRKQEDQPTPVTEPTQAVAAAPAAQETAPATPAAAEVSAAPPAAYTPVAAPEQAGRAYTIDNRAGYRKEASADGNLQIRFAKRPDGSRPDDELLAEVRGKQPDVKWENREQSWQAKTPKGVSILDDADDKLGDIGRRRGEGQRRG